MSNRETRRAQQRELARHRSSGPRGPLEPVPPENLAAAAEGGVKPPPGFERALQNGTYFVMDCARPDGVRLLMVRRIDGRDGIPWDDLQVLKGHAGYGDREAVEIYPPDARVVNQANMRHLWVLPAGEQMPFGLDKERDTRARLALRVGPDFDRELWARFCADHAGVDVRYVWASNNHAVIVPLGRSGLEHIVTHPTFSVAIRTACDVLQSHRAAEPEPVDLTGEKSP